MLVEIVVVEAKNRRIRQSRLSALDPPESNQSKTIIATFGGAAENSALSRSDLDQFDDVRLVVDHHDLGGQVTRLDLFVVHEQRRLDAVLAL